MNSQRSERASPAWMSFIVHVYKYIYSPTLYTCDHMLYSLGSRHELESLTLYRLERDRPRYVFSLFGLQANHSWLGFDYFHRSEKRKTEMVITSESLAY